MIHTYCNCLQKKDKKKRPSWKNDKLLRAPLSDSNSEDEDEAFKKIQSRQKKGEDSRYILYLHLCNQQMLKNNI